MNFKWINLFPPYLVRLIARDAGRGIPIPIDEICRRSGLSKRQVAFISSQGMWDRIAVGDMMNFMSACGVLSRGFKREREFILRSMAGSTQKMLSHIDRLPKAERLEMERIAGERSQEIAAIVTALRAR